MTDTVVLDSRKIAGSVAPTPAAHENVEQLEAAALADDAHIHAICDAWGAWCRTRRLYGPPRMLPSVLGRLTARPHAPLEGSADVACSADLASFHLAVIAQPDDALDRRVFESFYRHRLRPVKAVAAALEISPQHYYRVLREFRRRVYRAYREIVEAEPQLGGSNG